MKTVFTASRLYTPLEEIASPWLVVEDGQIVEVSSRLGKEACSATLVDYGDSVLAPGFFDIHIHGGAGLDVMRTSSAELPRLGKFLTTHGVTGYFPTTVAAPLDVTCAALERLADAIEKAQNDDGDASPQARPVGIHLEGPFLSQRWRFSSDCGKPRVDTCG
jgi:N-acetylglucosamine-6-phosphate deacetylase